jgi:transposase
VYGSIVRVFITAGTAADCTVGLQLIEGIDVLALLADKGYDTNAIVEYARKAGIEVCIPPKSNRKEQREYDEDLYKWRHIVENAFQMLKEWRGIATRYAKKTCSYLAAVQIRCLLKYLRRVM